MKVIFICPFLRGRKIYEPARYMSVNQAAEQLLEIIQNRRTRGDSLGMLSHNFSLPHWFMIGLFYPCLAARTIQCKTGTKCLSRLYQSMKLMDPGRVPPSMMDLAAT